MSRAALLLGSAVLLVLLTWDALAHGLWPMLGHLLALVFAGFCIASAICAGRHR